MLQRDQGRCLGDALSDEAVRQTCNISVPPHSADGEHIFSEFARRPQFASSQMALGEPQGRSQPDVVEAGSVQPSNRFAKLGDALVKPPNLDLAIAPENLG